MTTTLRIALLVGILFYVLFILVLLKKKSLELKYSLLWLITALVLLVLDIFPQIVMSVSKLLGVSTASNFIYLVVMFFMLLLLVSLTSIVSQQKRQIRTLIQTVSILKKKVEEIEKR